MESRVVPAVHLGHLDGGMYLILTSSGLVHSKHIRFFETTFPGVREIRENELRDDMRSQGLVTLDASDDETMSSTSEDLPEPDVASDGSSGEFDDALSSGTHYPEIPSTFDGTRYPDASENVPTPAGADQTPNHRYNLRSRATVAMP
ncbi:hypothetical protein BWQ96_10173 [Gracilariopsis chorda]|uniref:Uncharacterized protein n=1 Tax=Gracilariopsis chorda TaxID=448386 RepID=A0A2V3IDF3_9FLOR|nr:hypothetical protein BWQ96_10173 [Gracilariopsis chorda]|eukprot:PXF40112.1 hypothetical protein BWQ96_10173 [Gracilariopsis chorda]